MCRHTRAAAALFVLAALGACAPNHAEPPTHVPAPPTGTISTPTDQSIVLPAPQLKGTLTLEEALAQRRSVREFSDVPLTEAELGQLLWAGQGITHPDGLRTAPSAGALYPLQLHAATATGVFHYEPQGHRLTLKTPGDVRPALYAAALQQDAVLKAPLVIVISAVYARTAARYGPDRSPRYVHLEAGHAAQNILLQAVALGLAAVPIGAFSDDGVKKALGLPSEEQLLYLIPIGHPEQ